MGQYAGILKVRELARGQWKLAHETSQEGIYMLYVSDDLKI